MIFLSAGAFDEVQLKQMSYALDMLCKKYGITDKCRVPGSSGLVV